ncbi:Uncharacterized protein SCG7109_AO_00060 [Chlamydiales bacterium SCGC AG-110-M15]|nr:Uncharacterized protein SCG7109_AO_00060 [Chlamydiales bacterium SCGC AG-110-M15]
MRSYEWGIRNPVSINLILVIILMMGFVSGCLIKRELFPKFDTDIVSVTVVMEDGSTPEQIDRNIVQIILSEIQSIDGIKEIRSTSTDQMATLIIEVDEAYDSNLVKQEIKDEIDTIRDFPEKALDPNVRLLEGPHNETISLAVKGADRTTLELRSYADQIKQELETSGIASQVELTYPRKHELSVSLPLNDLHAKGLNINDVANQIRNQNLEGHAGEIKTRQQHIVLKGAARKTNAELLGQVPIKFGNGEFILLKDLATIGGIQDAFTEDRIIIEFQGEPSVLLKINKGVQEDMIAVAEEIKAFAKNLTPPPGIEVEPFHDNSIFVRERLDLIINNGTIGLILVILVLSIFLEWHVAFWASTGIAFSLIGALALLYFFGESLNMLSLFAFLMTMGVIVDDAIVIAESFFHKLEQKIPPIQAAKKALGEVFLPVMAMMSTTIIAFVPLLFISGMMGKFIAVIPIVVIFALGLSLFEAIFILPSHLAHHSDTEHSPLMRVVKKILSPLIYISKRANPYARAFFDLSNRILLQKILRFCLYHRYASCLFFVSILTVLFALIPAGIIKTGLFPDIDSDFHVARLSFDRGTSANITEKGMRKIEYALHKTAQEVEKESGQYPLKSQLLQIGTNGSHSAELIVTLVPNNAGRKISGKDFLARWRNKAPKIPEADSLSFESVRGGPRSNPIEVVISSPDSKDLVKFEQAIIAHLNTMTGIVDIRSSKFPNAHTLNITVKDEFNDLAVTERNLIGFLANAYQGIKVDTFYRNENEIKIYVRGDLNTRQSMHRLKNLQLPNGMTVGQVANIEISEEPGEVKRVNNERTLSVMANLDTTTGINAVEARLELKEQFLDPYLKEAKAKNKPVKWTYFGEAKRGSETIRSLIVAYVPAIFLIYFILATIFHSYLQPVIIMLATPFGFVGALLGHLLMGYTLNMMSLFGLVALTGIVVNDSLVLVDCINQNFGNSGDKIEDLILATKRRLRPIFLTSLTTIAGLTPVLFETSFQAQFLQPMVTSVVFGIAFSTALIVILIPVCYLVVDDIISLFTSNGYITHKEASKDK